LLKIDHRYHSFPDATHAKDWLQKQSFDKAFLLIKGSRSMQMEKLIEN